MKTKSIARFSLLCAMALVLGYIERFIPVAPGIPGVKLGLANTVLLYAVYLMGAKSAMLLMLAKVVLSGFLFAGLSGMLYSLAGELEVRFSALQVESATDTPSVITLKADFSGRRGEKRLQTMLGRLADDGCISAVSTEEHS